MIWGDIEVKSGKKFEDAKLILKMGYFFSIGESTTMDYIITLIFNYNATGFNGL